MKMNVRAMAITAGVIWGGAVLGVEVANRVAPGYGSGLLRMISSFYPGYKAGRSAKQIALGATYAFIDGASTGLMFALLYNKLDGQSEPETSHERLRAAS